MMDIAIAEPKNGIVLWITEKADVAFHLKNNNQIIDLISVSIPTQQNKNVSEFPFYIENISVNMWKIKNELLHTTKEMISDIDIQKFKHIQLMAKLLEMISDSYQKIVNSNVIYPDISFLKTVIHDSTLMEECSNISSIDKISLEKHFNLFLSCDNIRKATALGNYIKYVNKIISMDIEEYEFLSNDIELSVLKSSRV